MHHFQSLFYRDCIAGWAHWAARYTEQTLEIVQHCQRGIQCWRISNCIAQCVLQIVLHFATFNFSCTQPANVAKIRIQGNELFDHFQIAFFLEPTFWVQSNKHGFPVVSPFYLSPLKNFLAKYGFAILLVFVFVF